MPASRTFLPPPAQPPPLQPAPLPVWLIIHRSTDAVAAARVFDSEVCARRAIDGLASRFYTVEDLRRSLTVTPVYVETLRRSLQHRAPGVTVLQDRTEVLSDAERRAAFAVAHEYPDDHLATDPPPRLPMWMQRACFWFLCRVPDGPNWPRWWSRMWERLAEHTTPRDGF
jgi:hypothetical protein